ncbi:MAG: hypothetical protein V2B19_14985 [Pseudomonadota bacterium]
MVVNQRDGVIGLFDAIDGDTHVPLPGRRLHNLNVVDGLPIAIVHLESLPIRGGGGTA